MLILIEAVDAKMTDYTDSNYIPFQDGNAIFWQEFNYLAHSTNLTMLSEMAEETDGLSVYFPIIFRSWQPFIFTTGTPESITFLGTALKVIAGTPDFDDFEGLKFRQQELIASQNQ